MKKILALLFFALTFLSGQAQLKLSPNAEVSLYTCGMGDDLYALFGHTAIRIQDPEQNLDRVYNYGTFSFGDDFYTKFTMGQLNYKLSAYGFGGFESEYVYYQRSIDRQVLNLSQDQKDELYTLLEVNALPQNAYYLYDFFYDNCSTRPRDIINKVCDGNIKYPDLTNGSAKTFRQLIDEYLSYSPWADFGIDIGLGSVCDTPIITQGYMFLPDYLFKAYETATIDGKALVSTTENRFSPELERSDALKMSDPVSLFSILLVIFIAITYIEWRRKQRWVWIDKVFFSLVGLVGWLVFFLWFFTDHQATKDNWNILWAFPLNFPFALFIFRKRFGRIIKYYQWFLLWGCIILAAGWYVIPQQLHIAVFPILLIMILRLSHSLIRKYNQ